jgi:serine/threonine-protein kinase RsbW
MATELTIPNDLVSVYPITDMIEEALQEFAYTEHDIFAIKLALNEALVNAIKHGNQMDPDKWVHLAYTVTAERFDIRITDEGDGFDPDDPYDDYSWRPCGRGLLLMRAFMTEVRYHSRGNVVSMSKVREIASQVVKS